MKYELGWISTNGSRWQEAIFWEDGTIECGPHAIRKHKETGL
ncbi:MAG TPA: hypothetical protein PKE16_16415 [Hyphomicrobium sp.]|nr:hypothetical protein [Hyphomicrobium sp.]